MDSASSSAPELEDDLDPEPPEDGGERGAPRGPLPVGGWQYAEAPQPPPRVPFVVPRDVVTRMLCSTVHLKGAFADHVLDNLVDPTHRAMAPNWNIDTPMLVRHAQQARNRRMQREDQQCAERQVGVERLVRQHFLVKPGFGERGGGQASVERVRV